MPDHELPKYSPLPNKTADDEEPSSLPPLRSSPPSLPWRQLFIFVASATVTIALIIQLFWLLLSAAFGDGIEHGAESPGTKGGKDYYQTSPELYPGPTPTGLPGFLAQTNPAPFASTTFIPPSPLETQAPIQGAEGHASNDGNVFELMGQLSHYFSPAPGFGVEESPLTEGAEITHMHMLSRHGARYPTLGSGAPLLGEKIMNFTAAGVEGEFEGSLAFLNRWIYRLGAEILVPVGKQELFDSGTLHQYMYGHLYPNDGSKIVARSTTQDRMTKSAEYFLAGFFGLEWPQNATLVLGIEERGRVFNNSLAGWGNCPNSHSEVNRGGVEAVREWAGVYLVNATERLRAAAPGFNWTVADSYNAQSLCAYETVALGYSAFCDLFTYDEWRGYEYSIALDFAGTTGFQSPTGRAIGVGYVEEILARLNHHVLDHPVAQTNTTLDSNPDTFPIDQNIYFDFSHDTNIMAILTAFGFTQFATFLPATHMPAHRDLVVSHLTPFAARLDIEIIRAPSPIAASRSKDARAVYADGPPTTYIHFVLNQRTLPLGVSFPACGRRDDGWCELETFLEVQSRSLEHAQFEFACFGKYEAVPYGEITDGVPLATSRVR